MTTMIASLPEEKTKQTSGRQTGKGTRRVRPAGEGKSIPESRFFLSNSVADVPAPDLGREVSSDGEAMVEALKLGVTYYSLQEWRPVADFAGKNPELKREPVVRKAAV